MADSAKQNSGALLRRGIILALAALTAGCATPPPPSGYALGNGGRPVKNPQGVCVQIGPLNSAAENQGQCYQLAQNDLQEHVEPLPLDEFGYLFPPLKPEPKLAPATVSLLTPAIAAAPVQSVPITVSSPSIAALAAPSLPAAPVTQAPVVQYTTKVVHFSTRMPFKLNLAHLSRANRAALTAFVNSLEQYRGVESIRITGHTDSSGPARFNNWLSLMRAKSAQLWLLSLGVDPRMLKIQGVGSHEPRPHARNAADDRYVDIEVVVRVPAT